MDNEQSTSLILQCPRCHHHLQQAVRYCPQCGTNLGIAAAEEACTIKEQLSEAPPHATPETLFPRLGDYLVRRGLVAQEALDLALAYQEELNSQGETKLVGQILVENGILSRADLDLAVTEQVIELKSALEKTNRTLESTVTERTARLTQALNRLGELDKMKANFVANISHEFYTPLTHLIGQLELLVLEWPEPAMTHRFTSMMQASNRLWTLIDDLMQYATAITGNLKVSPQPISIAEPLNTAVLHKKSRAVERKITLNAKIAPDLPLVKADREKITWVIEQLLDNAIKFTMPKGQVVAYARRNINKVRIDVVDTGIGIPEDRIPELFLSFHQLEDHSRRHHEGLGLGLALAQQILDAHGSKIEVRSREGIGSHFGFVLPSHV